MISLGVIVFTGPSGVGKSTVVNHFLRKGFPFVKIPSYTTRSPRSDDKKGDYVYVTEEEFLKLKEERQFLETSYHYGSWYGTPLCTYYEYLEDGYVVLKDVNPAGAKSFKEEFGDICLSIFICPPSEEELFSRLYKRDGFVNEVRREESLEELRYKNDFDFCVVNNVLNDTIGEIGKILSSRGYS